MKTRTAHVATILGIVLSQLQFVWADPDASAVNKSCTSVVVLLSLLFTDPYRYAVAVTVVRVTVAALALLVAHLITKGTFGTAATGVLTMAAAVFARLPAALAAAPRVPAPGAGDGGAGTEGLGAMPRDVVPMSGGRGAGSGDDGGGEAT